MLATLAGVGGPGVLRGAARPRRPLGAIDRDRLNVAGSSLAAGHPFAATGGRIVATLAELLAERERARPRARSPSAPPAAKASPPSSNVPKGPSVRLPRRHPSRTPGRPRAPRRPIPRARGCPRAPRRPIPGERGCPCVRRCPFPGERGCPCARRRPFPRARGCPCVRRCPVPRGAGCPFGTRVPYSGARGTARQATTWLHVVTGPVGLLLSCPDHRPVAGCSRSSPPAWRLGGTPTPRLRPGVPPAPLGGGRPPQGTPRPQKTGRRSPHGHPGPKKGGAVPRRGTLAPGEEPHSAKAPHPPGGGPQGHPVPWKTGCRLPRRNPYRRTLNWSRSHADTSGTVTPHPRRTADRTPADPHGRRPSRPGRGAAAGGPAAARQPRRHPVHQRRRGPARGRPQPEGRTHGRMAGRDRRRVPGRGERGGQGPDRGGPETG